MKRSCRRWDPTGYDRLAAPNRKPYATRDGYMAILPYNTAHWAAFFELIGRPELAQSPQVQDPVLRSENVDALYARDCGGGTDAHDHGRMASLPA